MKKPSLQSRRRFICISATVSGLTMLPGLGRAALTHTAGPLKDYTWEGIALGADASLRISHHDPDAAQQLITRCVAEVQRLEKLFSLYRDDSALSQLNRQGSITNPSSDLLALLSQSINFGHLTNGVFDITVQPLWAAYAQHFSSSTTPPLNGPDQTCIQDALNLVDYRKLKISNEHVAFDQAGMAITLNGIAQGYITDRVTQLLSSQGIKHALVNMGEIRGINNKLDGAPWRVGLENPLDPGTITRSISLENQAVATSGGYGTPMGPGYNHLLDPRSGASSHLYHSVSVVASNATTADALSTAFSFMPEPDIQTIASQLKVGVYLTRKDGSHTHLA